MSETNIPENSNASEKPKSHGLPLWTVMAALLILALVGVASLGTIVYLTRSDKARVEKEMQALKNQQARDKVATEKAAEESKLATARTRQEELLAHVRSATNSLERLRQDVKQAAADADSLKSNEIGQKVALHPDLVAQARRLYERELPSLPASKDIIAKLEGMRRAEQQLLSASGSSFQPDADMALAVQNAGFWGQQQLDAVDRVKTLLSSLIQESKIKVAEKPFTANSPTLEATIARMAEAESKFRQQTIIQATSQASTQAVDTVAIAESQRIIESARLEASNILAQVNETKAKQHREDVVRQAVLKVEDTKATVQAQQSMDEARNIELRKKASGPEIQVKLAPFITPGYWSPKSVSYDKKPHSFKHLQSFGALDPSLAGLRKLAQLGMSPADRVRPRWKLPVNWPKIPEAMEKIKEAQQLLMELGPVLVDMKLLDE